MRIYHHAKRVNNTPMHIKEIRKANLDRLLTEHKAAYIASKAETKPAYISQIVTGVKTRGGKVRGIGDDLARKIEVGLKLPDGWMDQLHTPGINETPPVYGKQSALMAKIHKNLAMLTDTELNAVDIFINHLIDRRPNKKSSTVKTRAKL